MPAIELLSGYATAPSTTLTALTMASGNSLTVRNSPEGSDIFLLQAWADSQTSGNVRIKSPRFHDNVQGIRLRSESSLVTPLLPARMLQRLVPQDTLTVEISGSGTAGDLEGVALLVYYADLPGVEGDYMTPEDVASAAQHILTVENTLSLGTGGGYTGEEALNVEFDQFKGNTRYAILGYACSAECLAVRYRSSDFGNIGIGGPGNDTDKGLTKDFFVTLSEDTGLPCVPAFNSANLSNILIDGVQDENGTDVTVTTYLAELGS